MSRARRVLAAVIVTITTCALALPLGSSAAAYGYDGTRTTSTAGGRGATETPPEQPVVSRAALGERAPDAYDGSANFARASARRGLYRSAPRAIGAADEVLGSG